MPVTRKDLLQSRADDASQSDKLVLALLSERPSRSTAVQKIGLLLETVRSGKVPAGFSPYFFGGFDEDIDDSLGQLKTEGYVCENDGVYTLTSTGKELLETYLKDEVTAQIKSLTAKIVPRLARLTDQEILAVMYELFPELTTNSLIKDRVPKVRRIKNVEIATIPP